MKSDVGQKTIENVCLLSKDGFKNLPTNYYFPTINLPYSIGSGYVSDAFGNIKVIDNLSNIKIILHPDGSGGFILKSAFPTI